MKKGNDIACYLVIGEFYILHASPEKRDLFVKAVLSAMKTSRAIPVSYTHLTLPTIVGV